MRLTQKPYLVALAAVLLIVVGVAVAQDPVATGPQTVRTDIMCDPIPRALPEWHPPVANTQRSDWPMCYTLATPISYRSSTMPPYDRLADYLEMPQQSGIELVAETGEDASIMPIHGDCATCHTDTQVLSDGHVPTTGMSMAQCSTCHVPQSDLSLDGKMPLDHRHGLAGVSCAACHDGNDTAMQEPPMETCQVCHGSLDDLAALTADVMPTNPHSSPHGAPFAECSLCHMQHQPSQNFCADCHDFEFNLP